MSFLAIFVVGDISSISSTVGDISISSTVGDISSIVAFCRVTLNPFLYSLYIKACFGTGFCLKTGLFTFPVLDKG